MKKKMILAVGCVALMFLGVTHGFAQGPGVGPGHGRMHFQESLGFCKSPQLTPEQRTQLQELRRKFEQENAQLIGALVAKRLEVRSLWTDSKADPKVIQDKEKELSDLQTQMRSKRVQLKLEVRKFLSPEQMANWKPEWRRGRGPMMAHAHRMHPGGTGMMGRGRMMDCGEGRGPWGGRGVW